ncbi:DUF4365 domain-containing protein [Sphingobium sp. AP49]|uniref:DUF4365 domain-containing protein n=1 Tax=Sphingobium sp. AP49 TaxID=1144307 RepID=UPI0002E9529C|nr:DUF4365 domain-containing protein [Sphingobium sp. AP49]WHO37234.1 DUF4365 domain-containing protein [Sphingobium sp. AP49]
MTRKRSKNARTERAGINAVDDACTALDLIWRDLFQEDVGVDGTIEVCIGEFPSGKLVGAQVKSGSSYIRSESASGFRFYPDADDLAYWGQLSIPLFLFVHNPADRSIYWVDVTKHIQERTTDPLGPPYIAFSKSNRINEDFYHYLTSLFDLTSYGDAKFAAVRAELEAISHTDGVGSGRVTVTGLDLFTGGLWGLCSKLQFHSSLLSDLFRKAVNVAREDVVVRYSFSRGALYPFFTRYIDVLMRHHLALIDGADINHSLYAKLEFPTFLAPLTLNGRRFVKYLRSNGREDAHDNRFFTLTLVPHTQIEVYASFEESDVGGRFGPYTDVLSISFNPHLDYYRLIHWRRASPESRPEKLADQTIYFFELIDHLDRSFGKLDKDVILLRHLDQPLTPLISWLESWYGIEQPFSASVFEGKSNLEMFGFHDELSSIMGAAGVMEISEPALPEFPLRRLASGEIMKID